MCDLLVEIAGAIYDDKSEKWQDLFGIIFKLVNSEDPKHIDGGLSCLSGLFAVMVDEFNGQEAELLGILKAKLMHNDLDIQLSALQAVSSYLGMAQRKYTKPYKELIPQMV